MKTRHQSMLLGVSVILVFGLFPTFSLSQEVTVALSADPGLTKPFSELRFFGSFGSEGVPFRNIHDSLFYVLPDASIRMGIAENFEANSDASVWRISLKQGVKFHNGKIVNSNDVKLSFDSVLRSGIGWLKDRFSSIQDIVIVDEFTFEVLTKDGFALVPYILGHYLPIVPSDYDSENPIGCGPYRFVNYSKGDNLIIKGFKDYYGGIPYFEKINMRFIPEMASRVKAFQAGDVQLASDIPYDYIEQVKLYGKGYIVPQASRIYYLGINTQKPRLNEVSVRQGLNHAINREGINKELFNGKALLSAGPISPDSFGANPEIRPYSYDPEKAKRLVKDPFKIYLAYFGPEILIKNQALVIKDNLNSIGIKVEEVIEDPSRVYDLYKKGKLDVYLGWIWDRPEPYTYLNYLFNSRNRLLYYHNPEIVKNLEIISKSLERNQRREIYRKLDTILYDDAPLVYLYSVPDSFFAGSKKYDLTRLVALMLPSNQCISCNTNSDCGDGYICHKINNKKCCKKK